MKKRYLLIFLAVIIILLLSGLYYLHYRGTHITTDSAYVEGKIYIVSAKIPGTVRAVYVEDNKAVKKGDLLLELDEKDYEVKVVEAKSALEAEKRRLEEIEESLNVLKNRLFELDAAIKAEQANIEAQRSMLEQSKLDLNRAERLYSKDALPKDKYEKALTAMKVQESVVRAAEERLKQLEVGRRSHLSQIKQIEKTIETQKAIISLRRATLEDVLLKKSYTKIYAPSDGYVTKKSVEVGNHVQPGQPLLSIVPLSDIWIVANYKETQIEKIRRGQRVKIKVDAFPSLTFYGVVDSIMAGTGAAFSLFPPENATGNFVKIVQRIPVKIVLDENPKKELLRIGMSCVPTIIVR